MCSLQSLAASTQREGLAPFHMVPYSAFCLNPKPQGENRWSNSDPRLQDNQTFLPGVCGLSSHLAAKQRSKDAHPVERRGRNWGKLNRLVQMPPQAPSQHRENRTGPVRGFIQMNACGGGDKENLMCLL